MTFLPSLRRSALVPSLLFAAACASGSADPQSSGDLTLGDAPENLNDGEDWGSALDCKSIPDLPALSNPRITISLDGLTAHLVDPDTGYDRVFPIGVGQIEDDAQATAYGESKSYYPVLESGTHDFALHPRTADSCRTWWTDPDSGEESPVFAGMPFMPFYGAYAMHGPIDHYRAPNGGSLRRGFVSHGCIRMEAADILELYARTKTLDRVPVHLQREPERLASGARVDLDARWIGAECRVDGDCNYPGGICRAHPLGGPGFCTAACTSTCADRGGASTTFCIPDPQSATSGICMNQVTAQNPDCRAFGEMRPASRTRFGQAEVDAVVCIPASRGSIGDPCLADEDCRNGASCAGAVTDHAGICTMSCETTCPDEPDAAITACAGDAVPGSGFDRACLRSCTPSSNASECVGDTRCVARDPSSATDTRFVCKPRA